MVYTPEDLLIEISDRLRVMRTQETSQYFVPDYLAEEWQQKLRDATGPCEDSWSSQPTAALPSFPSTSSGDDDSSSATASQINELWREKICEWCYRVVDHLAFNREVVSVAMSYLDRYLAIRTVNRRVFQLAATTALYLAIKLFEPKKLSISSLIYLSRGLFTAEHIMSMENSMLQTLNWHVNPPTPYAFCRDLMLLVSGDITPRARYDVNELAHFLTELSVCDYWFATKKPSSIAAASIVNAIVLQGPRRLDPKHKVELLHHIVDIGIDIAYDEEIIECYERLREMYIAGGFTPNLERATGEGGSHVVAVGPTGVADGPAVDDPNEEANVPLTTSSQAQEVEDADAPLADARTISPSAVILESPSRFRKRKTRPSTRSTQAKRARKNLSRELNDEVEDLSQYVCVSALDSPTTESD